MVEIRPYQLTDYPGVLALLQEVDLYADVWDTAENLAGMLADDPQAILVALDGGVIVGNVFLVPFGPKVMHLYRLAVKPSYQNRGIASQLINESIKIVRAKGVVEIGVFVDGEKEELLNFYKKRSFTSSQHAYFHMWKEVE